MCLLASIVVGHTQIDQVTLTFSPVDGGSDVTITASDNGSGLEPDGALSLLESTEYAVTINLGDDQTTYQDQAEDIQFFFGFTEGLLNGDVQIDDSDANSLPVGFESTWITTCLDEAANGTFNLQLQDLDGNKSAGSTADDGTTVFSVAWTMNVDNDADAPACENEEEIITDVVLTFTPMDGGEVVTARAQDPDGEGVLPLEVIDDIELLESTEYVLTMSLTNEIEGEDITEEIREEDEEHLFFFAFSDDLIRSPSGDGNADNRADEVNYQDFDSNGLPVGLETGWTTICTEEDLSGTFRVVLKHQPDSKSETSTINDGGTDVDLTWTMNVSNDADAPSCENEEEIITDVVLTFTPMDGGDVVTARAQDPDGEGVLPLEVLDVISLAENTTYTMEIAVSNEIEGEDITEEIREEADEHMFFFGFSEGIFSDPTGDGNIDNRQDPLNYNDLDGNNYPVGLSTEWTTAAAMNSGTLQIVLKHQPDSKSAASTVNEGGTDIDLTWDINTVVTNTREVFSGNESALRIQPNPVRSSLNWKWVGGDLTDQTTVRVVSVNGQIVYEANGFDRPMIETSDWIPGIYILQVVSSEAIHVRRFVKASE